jgi:hypothetical protein
MDLYFLIIPLLYISEFIPSLQFGISIYITAVCSAFNLRSLHMEKEFWSECIYHAYQRNSISLVTPVLKQHDTVSPIQNEKRRRYS